MADIIVAGNTSGAITISAPLVAGSGTLTLPTGTDTLVGKATTDTLTNKTLVAVALGTPASGVLTNCTGVVAGALPAGSVIQVVQTLNSANTSGSVSIPDDNTIPQITEGAQYLTCTIVPKIATSKLLVEVILYISEATNVHNNGAAAIFRDATASAIAVGALFRPDSLLDAGTPTVLSILTPSNSVSSTTFTVRAGMNNAGGALVMNTNANGSYPVYGGVYYSGITITEVAA